VVGQGRALVAERALIAGWIAPSGVDKEIGVMARYVAAYLLGDFLRTPLCCVPTCAGVAYQPILLAVFFGRRVPTISRVGTALDR